MSKVSWAGLAVIVAALGIVFVLPTRAHAQEPVVTVSETVRTSQSKVLGRSVWLSGNVQAAEIQAQGHPTTLAVGYLLGCQVDLRHPSGALATTVHFPRNVDSALVVGLPAGRTVWVQVDHRELTEAGVHQVGYRDLKIEVLGCPGKAQVRSVSMVESTGRDHSKMSLYGRPFTIS